MSDRQRTSRQANGVGRVLAKLNSALEGGNYYEAHQMYRTLYFRYSSQKKFEDLESLLFEGAVKFFTFGQTESGVDLAKLYLEILIKGNSIPNEVSLQNVARLYMFFPWSSPDRESFKAQSIKWSSQDDRHSKGHPRLHQLLAYSLWHNKRYAESRNHFLFSCDGVGCGSMLVDFHRKNGFPRELDLFVVGTVLQLISLKKHIDAAYAFKAYTEHHPNLEQRSPPYKHPLLNFVWLLLVAIEQRKSLTTLSTLVEKYEPSLRRDPVYFEYIDKIGQTFFGVTHPQRQQPRPGGMFAGLFDSLINVLGNEGEFDDYDDQVASSSRGARSNVSSGASSASARSPTAGRSMTSEDLD